MKPLVSILIPAYNAGNWIADTIRSALAQTWPRKEIIVVDDGSSDNTLEVARSFEGPELRVIGKRNEGAAATRNRAMAESRGDYIQWLDADDLLSPGKVEAQMARLLSSCAPRRLLASGPWAYFAYRPWRARFERNSLWNDLSPAEWLYRKMSENLHMQTATWLTSRELAEEAGLWDTNMLSDDDGEYFCRVLRASDGVLFCEQSRVYYRSVSSSRLSFIGASDRKMDAMLGSMKLHISYLLGLEDSPRTRAACLQYVRNWQDVFQPQRTDIFDELRRMAEGLGGALEQPRLRGKYEWLTPLIGRPAAWKLQLALPHHKARALCLWDRFMSGFEHRRSLPTGS